MIDVLLSVGGGTELLQWVAIAVVILGVFGSLAPLVPGPLLSLGGVYLYWWATGYTDPDTVVLGLLTGLALLIVALDWLAGFLSARIGGAPTSTSLLAGVAGFALFFVAGPLGILLGVAGVVFALEFYRTGDANASGRTAVYTTVGMLASTVAQVLLTALLAITFLFVVLL